jgi:hypothetical protein
MAKLAPTSRAYIFGVKYPKGYGLNMEEPYVYVGWSTQGLDKALASLRSRIKNVKDSKKMQELKVDVSKLTINLLRNTTAGEAPTLVNEYIKKHDTFNNGWNSEFTQ